MAAVTPTAVANVPQFASISVNTSGDNALVAGTAGYMVVALGFVLVPPNNQAVTIEWKSSGGTVISGAMPIGGANNPPDLVCPDGPHGYVASLPGEGLTLNLSGAYLMTGHLTYWLAPSY